MKTLKYYSPYYWSPPDGTLNFGKSPNPNKLPFNSSVIFIFHVLFHLILQYWGVLYPISSSNFEMSIS